MLLSVLFAYSIIHITFLHLLTIVGKNLILSKFPSNYSFWVRAGGGQPPKYFLFGHPSGRPFESAEQFSPHLRWLLGENQKDGDECKCEICLMEDEVEQ